MSFSDTIIKSNEENKKQFEHLIKTVDAMKVEIFKMHDTQEEEQKAAEKARREAAQKAKRDAADKKKDKSLMDQMMKAMKGGKGKDGKKGNIFSELGNALKAFGPLGSIAGGLLTAFGGLLNVLGPITKAIGFILSPILKLGKWFGGAIWKGITVYWFLSTWNLKRRRGQGSHA